MSDEEKMELGEFYDFVTKLLDKDFSTRLYSYEDVMQQPFMQKQWKSDLPLQMFTIMENQVMNLIDIKFKNTEQVFEKSLLMQKVLKIELSKNEPKASELSR